MIENFGLYLKHERELRGVALEKIAETTKIHIRFLKALENNDFDDMPGEVFVKGFIRSYAKVIGIDSEEMANAYDESVGRVRREEFEKVQVINKKIQSRKKVVVGSLIWGIVLAVVLSLGYLVAENIIDENKKHQGERLPTAEPSFDTEKPPISSETSPSDDIESDNAGNLEVPLEESLQGLSPSSDPETLSESTSENPSMSSSTVSIPEVTQVEVKKQGVARVEPERLEEPSKPVGHENMIPDSPIGSAVKEKNSNIQNKPMITQQVLENSALLGVNDQ